MTTKRVIGITHGTPAYETADAAPFSRGMAAKKAHFETMIKILREENKRHPLLSTTLHTRRGWMFFAYKEPFPGAEKVEKRFISMGERLQKLVKKDAEKYEREMNELEFDAQTEEMAKKRGR